MGKKEKDLRCKDPVCRFKVKCGSSETSCINPGLLEKNRCPQCKVFKTIAKSLCINAELQSE